MPSDVNGLRVDTLANWQAAAGNYVPLDGEIILVSDLGMLVRGDGSDVDTSTKISMLPGVPNTVTGNHTITDYEGTINVNAESATITLPSSTGSGRRVTVRKISASAGTVTISRAGSDTITSGSLTSVTLTSEGDYWTLEDVASGRWELTAGHETSANGTGKCIRTADGKQCCYLSDEDGAQADATTQIEGDIYRSANDELYEWSFPFSFSSAPGCSAAGVNTLTVLAASFQAVSNGGGDISILTNGSRIDRDVTATAIGPWY